MWPRLALSLFALVCMLVPRCVSGRRRVEGPILRPGGCDVQGMAAGHAYYFLEDVYPLMTGRRILKTPAIIKALIPEDTVLVARPAPAVWGAAPAAPHRD